MKIEIEKLNTVELDALKEVANIGAAHAATALSQMIEKTVLISVSEVHLFPVSTLMEISGNGSSKIVLVHLKLLGGATGGLMLIWSWEDALKFSAILRKESVNGAREFREADFSALKESGSILAAAYLNAIGDLMHLSLIPTVPELHYGAVDLIVPGILRDLAKRSEIAFCLETEFVENRHKLRGKFLLIPEMKSLDVMFNQLGVRSQNGTKGGQMRPDPSGERR